jgi:hypothetical protein
LWFSPEIYREELRPTTKNLRNFEPTISRIRSRNGSSFVVYLMSLLAAVVGKRLLERIREKALLTLLTELDTNIAFRELRVKHERLS